MLPFLGQGGTRQLIERLLELNGGEAAEVTSPPHRKSAAANDDSERHQPHCTPARKTIVWPPRRDLFASGGGLHLY
jgi:hypothetical protein